MTQLKYIEGSLTGKRYKPDIMFSFRLAIPCAPVADYALLIEHDGQNDANVHSMLRLADEGKAPYCVSIGVCPGVLTLSDGTQRNMRMNNYDLFDREYGDFLVYELIPYIKETYGISFSASPDMHFVSGGSSGGISALVIAWFHSDYFHRVYISSPSFLAMGRGNEIPYLIRKYETKPLRIYEECSENEPNEYFGWSRGIDEEAREAFTFAGYHFKYKYFAGEGHCSRYRDEDEAYKRNEWIWQDWQKEPIVAKDNSPRVKKVIPYGSRWEVCSYFPSLENAVPEMLAEKYKNAVLSNDGQAWYAANEFEDTVYMYIRRGDHLTDHHLTHALLHTIPQQMVKGAIAMAVDKSDRLYVLTEIGIQCVRSFGLIDVILALPDATQPKKIAVDDALYVQTEKGIYRRELCEECIADCNTKRRHVGYYD